MKPQMLLRPRPGYSLVEMSISLTLSALVVAVLFGTIANMQKAYRGQRDTRASEEAMRTAEQVLRTVLQSAGADPRATGQGLLHPDPMGANGFDDLRVKSDINPPDGLFTGDLEDVTVRVQADTLMMKWTSTGSFQPLAYPIRALLFEYFDTVNAPLTTIADVANATSVRITISAPENPVSNILRSRQAWIFLQNRR
ncbi:MAG: hypothetical protein ACREK1_00820 [Longimicrobiales bacterium]